MPRIKRKFNTKLFKRFTKKELTDFMRKNKLPTEKALSKYTKAEIVSQLIRLQRNKLYYDAFANLKIKPARKLSDKQRLNLEAARGRLQSKALKTKQAFPDSKNADTGRKVENRISTKVLADNPVQEEIKMEAATLVNQQPSQLEQVKEQAVEEDPLQFQNLEDMFAFSDRKLNEQRKEIMELLNQRKQQQGVPLGQTGKQPDIEEQGIDITPEEQKEEPATGSLPPDISNIIQEQVGRVDSDFLVIVNKLTIPELKAVLDEVQISRRGITKKAVLAQVVAANKTKTNQIVREKVKIKEAAKQTINKKVKQRQEVQTGQVVKDNEGAKAQASKRNVLPQGDGQAVQDVVNKKVGNLDKPKTSNGNGKKRRSIVVKK